MAGPSYATRPNLTSQPSTGSGATGERLFGFIGEEEGVPGYGLAEASAEEEMDRTAAGSLSNGLAKNGGAGGEANDDSEDDEDDDTEEQEQGERSALLGKKSKKKLVCCPSWLSAFPELLTFSLILHVTFFLNPYRQLRSIFVQYPQSTAALLSNGAS